ncbi:glycoside hydrolase family 31 [Turneriella parva DSM 21527]|uniref:Glycoside hydrolase family 31 n=1 Tax=Turneriella parva (strain ATCC BAA-1111 / DSM 21527 / NCTC 11395 / H) TaxID=869212 RepID=I4BB22_TURPD|nr:glycoside hydrolase family 31 [Turneriella parva DSM 21527]
MFSALVAIPAGCFHEPVKLAPSFMRHMELKPIIVDTTQSEMRILDERQNRVLLRLSLSDAFLSLRRAEDMVRERMASYTMADTVKENCRLKQLASGKVEPEGILIEAHLNCSSGATAIADLTIRLVDGAPVMAIKARDHRFNRLQLVFQAEPDEHIFGGGEQFTHLDLRGKRLPMLTEEQGVGRGAQPITAGANITAGAGGSDVTTYAPVPFFFTSAYRSFDTVQNEYQVWNFGRSCYSVDIWQNELQLSFNTSGSYAALIEKYTARTGRMRPLPDWALGTILGVQGGKDKVEQVLNAALAAGNPVTAIWIQDWVGRRLTNFGSQLWWRWLPDEKAYPNFRGWVASLRARGIRVLGYVNPFLADEGPIFEEAKQRGFLVRDRLGQPYKIRTVGFPAYLIDLANANARTYLKGIIKQNMLQAGLAGYMADFGEWLPWDSQMADGERGAAWHNRYATEWARLNREVIRESGLEGEVVFFTRSGFTGSAAHSTLFWAGDQLVTFDEFDGLASAITGMLTGGVSGLTLNHSDIGGYTTINNPLKNYHRSRELLLRWAEMAVFTPFFRNHEGNRPEKNYQVYSDERITGEFAALGRLHQRLAPLMKQLMAEAAASGMPLMRPLFLHYPADHNTFALRHQFMLGRDVIVAPVIKEGALKGRVYLPAGGWIESSTGTLIRSSGWHEFAAPLGVPVAFIRADAPEVAALEALLAPEKKPEN